MFIAGHSGAVVQLSSDLFFCATEILPQAAPGILYTPDFFLSQETNPWWSAGHWEVLSRAQVRERISGLDSVKPAMSWREPDQAYFADCFAQTQAMIASREIEKIVPVVFAESEFRFRPEHRGYFLRQIAHAPEGAYGYGFWCGDQAMFGITPEILFAIDDRRMSSTALAGTRPGEATDRLPLLEDAKELAEHGIVVRELERRLSKWGVVLVEKTGVMKFPGLEHLYTRLRVELREDVDCMAVVSALHPTPAIGGYPREASLKILKNWSRERRRFGAPFGVNLPDGRSHCLVAIRNIQWQGERAWLGSGCGVVAQSVLSREWDELTRKRQSVLRILGLA